MTTLTITQFLESPTSRFLSPRKIAESFALQLGDVAEFAGVHRNTVTSRPQSPKVQALLRDFVRVVQAATETFGDREKAVAWMMNEPLSPFRYKTPLTLIRERRADDLIAYLDSIESGFVG